MNLPARSRVPLLVGFTLLLLCVPACQNGHISVLGYSTEPVYDPNIRTVYVPIAGNVSFRRGIEFEMTRAIVREIETSSPLKVVSCREEADTELLCKIVNWRKGVININQLNEVREAEVGVAVEIVWRDLRPGAIGDVLSLPKAKNAGFGLPPLTPPPAPLPLLVQPTGTFIPELGGSATTADKQMIDNLARGIVFKMEIARPW